MVVSGADKTLTVLKGGDVAFTAPVTIRDPETPLGNVVYVLKQTNAAGSPGPRSPMRATWQPAGQGGERHRPYHRGAGGQQDAGLAAGAGLDHAVVTDLPAHPGTRTDDDFRHHEP